MFTRDLVPFCAACQAAIRKPRPDVRSEFPSARARSTSMKPASIHQMAGGPSPGRAAQCLQGSEAEAPVRDHLRGLGATEKQAATVWAEGRPRFLAVAAVTGRTEGSSARSSRHRARLEPRESAPPRESLRAQMGTIRLPAGSTKGLAWTGAWVNGGGASPRSEGRPFIRLRKTVRSRLFSRGDSICLG